MKKIRHCCTHNQLETSNKRDEYIELMLRLVKTKKQIDEETSFKNDLSDLRKDIKNLLDDKEVKKNKQIDEEISFKDDLGDLRKDIKNLLDDKGITGGNQQKGRTSLNEEILKLKRENEDLKKRS